MIIISDFPRIRRQYALSSAAYKLSQDLKRAQDLGLSGVPMKDKNGKSINVKGYGVYININNTSGSDRQYLIYADVNNNHQKYDFDFTKIPLCSSIDQNQILGGALTTDCVVEVVNLIDQDTNLYIKGLDNINGNQITSINFSPPNPSVKIDNIKNPSSEVGIVLGLKLTSDNPSEREVFVNTSGLIYVGSITK